MFHRVCWILQRSALRCLIVGTASAASPDQSVLPGKTPQLGVSFCIFERRCWLAQHHMEHLQYLLYKSLIYTHCMHTVLSKLTALAAADLLSVLHVPGQKSMCWHEHQCSQLIVHVSCTSWPAGGLLDSAELKFKLPIFEQYEAQHMPPGGSAGPWIFQPAYLPERCEKWRWIDAPDIMTVCVAVQNSLEVMCFLALAVHAQHVQIV